MSNLEKNRHLIEIRGMTKTYIVNGEDVRVLPEINMSVAKNEMVAIMGPSGSGKSTLLFILGLFLSPSSGSYAFDGHDILDYSRSRQAKFRRERIGFVLQGADLFEHSTVYENVEYPLIYAKSRPAERYARIHEVLTQVNLSNRIHQSSNKLSGGEKQRVAIARAMVNSPEVILADEPTGQLDADNSRQIMKYFKEISTTTDTAMVIVTHDPRIADECDKVFRIQDGQFISS